MKLCLVISRNTLTALPVSDSESKLTFISYRQTGNLSSLLLLCLNRSQHPTFKMNKWYGLGFFFPWYPRENGLNSVMSNIICTHSSTSCHVFIQRKPAKEESSLVVGTLLTMGRVCFPGHFHTQHLSLNVCPPPLSSFLSAKRRSWLQIIAFAFFSLLYPHPNNLSCEVSNPVSVSFVCLQWSKSQAL